LRIELTTKLEAESNSALRLQAGHVGNEKTVKVCLGRKARRLQRKVCEAEETEAHLKGHLNDCKMCPREREACANLRSYKTPLSGLIVSTSPLGGMTDYQPDGARY